MKLALALSWLCIAVLLSLHWVQRRQLAEVRQQAWMAWAETQTMPYVKSYDYRDKVEELEGELASLKAAFRSLEAAVNDANR